MRDGPAPDGRAVVAILDTGVDATHPDLAGRLLPGMSSVDGVAADTDPNGHGTWMAGIVAAETDNGEGIRASPVSRVRVLPVTVLGADGTGLDSDIVEGIVAAVDAGADVILMAFSAPGYSSALQAAVDYAWAHDVVVVAATGNEGSTAPTYPAGDRGVIGVTATDRDDLLAPGSNSGPAAFMAAPGVDILTTDAGGGYRSISGTSAAAAEVAGAAGAPARDRPGRRQRRRSSGASRAAPRRPTRRRTPATDGSTWRGRRATPAPARSSRPARRDRRRRAVHRTVRRGRRRGRGPAAAATTTGRHAANWGGTAPGAGDDLVFPAGAARLANTNDYAAGRAFNSITITGTGYTLERQQRRARRRD